MVCWAHRDVPQHDLGDSRSSLACGSLTQSTYHLGGAWVVSYSNLLVRDALALCEHPQSTLVIPSEDLASGQFTQSQGYPIVRTRPSHDTDLREARELHGQLKNIVLLFIDIEGVQGCGAQAHLGHPLSMRLDGCHATYLCGRKDSI